MNILEELEYIKANNPYLDDIDGMAYRIFFISMIFIAMAVFVYFINKSCHSYRISIWGMAFGTLFIAICLVLMTRADIDIAWSDLILKDNIGAKLISFEQSDMLERIMIDVDVRRELSMINEDAQIAYIFEYYTINWIILCLILEFVDYIGLKQKIIKLFQS